MKRARPCRHVRRVRTRQGRRVRLVNAYVPPAWKKVRRVEGKSYVATGVDVKGRTQYVYPKSHVRRAGRVKQRRVALLEKRIPKVLGRVNADIRKGVEEAEVVYTMYKTGFRPGSRRGTLADVESRGVTTLERKNVKLLSNKLVRFDFVGKKGVQVEKDVRDDKLWNIFKKRIDSPRVFHTTDGEVRRYFKTAAGGKFTLKDLRTLKANVVARRAVARGKTRKEVGQAVAKELSNTPAVALESYVNPELVS